jgi:hypothetical protein
MKLADPCVKVEGVASGAEAAAAPQKKKKHVVPPWLARKLARRLLAPHRLAHRLLPG